MTISIAQQARITKHLNDLVRVNGNVMTRSGMVDHLLSSGFSLVIRQEPRIKPLSRRAFNQADNRQQRAHESRMKMAGMKDVYVLQNEEGNVFDITKIQYDYGLTVAL